MLSTAGSGLFVDRAAVEGWQVLLSNSSPKDDAACWISFFGSLRQSGTQDGIRSCDAIGSRGVETIPFQRGKSIPWLELRGGYFPVLIGLTSTVRNLCAAMPGLYEIPLRLEGQSFGFVTLSNAVYNAHEKCRS